MNKKGEVQLVFTLLVSSILLTIYLYFQFSVVSVRKMQERFDTYLCYKNYKKDLTSLTATIAKSNATIASLVPLLLVPASAKMAKVSISAIQATQNLKLKHFQTRALSNPYCHLSLKGMLLLAHPYRTINNIKFYRDQSMIAHIGKHEWSLNLFGKKSISPTIRLKLSHNSALSSRTLIDATELGMLAPVL